MSNCEECERLRREFWAAIVKGEVTKVVDVAGQAVKEAQKK